MKEARRLSVTGIVQGVGFRPFIARLAHAHRLTGWVRNGPHGVDIHVEGSVPALRAFAVDVETQAPAASRIESVVSAPAALEPCGEFRIHDSEQRQAPTARISPDLPVCDACLREMRDPTARRFGYPYINCTGCGPRYSIVRALPYDRARTTMAAWPMCAACAGEYRDPRDRRFHAEPIACPACGPSYRLVEDDAATAQGQGAIAGAARLLGAGAVVAVKGIGGYHLCCDARNAAAVGALRERKYRKAKPFALMARDLHTAHAIVQLDAAAVDLLTSRACPIVLAPARATLTGVAPDHHELGVMLPYAPIHHLLFAAGAPDLLVMTSANRSSEPITFEEEDAMARLRGIADAFLVGEREIARRVEDSVARSGSAGPVILRRGRGYAPAVVARLPGEAPVLAVGADLKNTVTLVVGGQALTSPHIGDLEHLSASDAFDAAVDDLASMYEIDWTRTTVAHDLHPHYASTARALALPAGRCVAVQHHRAHVASVLAERGELDARVIGVAFDGTGYGDDGTIWGGEFFVGSMAEGLPRVASLRPFALLGGDAAARYPVQAAAGLLSGVEGLPDLASAPFSFPDRYRQASRLAAAGLRTFTTTSAGRLFDSAAAVLGFTGGNEFEGQAAMWLESLASRATAAQPLPFETAGTEVDLRAAVRAMAERRLAGEDERRLARAFHESVAAAIAETARRLCDVHHLDTIVLSGGTFQNKLLVDLVRARLGPTLHLWTNAVVPANDGGISLGQAAWAAVRSPGPTGHSVG